MSRFNLSELDITIQKERPKIIYMLEETWCKVDMKHISHEKDRKYYRGIRAIVFQGFELLGLSKENRMFFEGGGVEAE